MSTFKSFCFLLLITILLPSGAIWASSISGKVFQGNSSNPVLLSGTEEVTVSVYKKDDLLSSGNCDGWCSAIIVIPPSGVDATGSYIISSLEPGEYILVARSAYGANFLKEWWASPASTRNREEAQVISLHDNEDIGNINFNLDPGGTIAGKIFNSDGITLLNSQLIGVRVYDEENRKVIDRTNILVVDGVYKVVSIPTGHYFLQAFLYGSVVADHISYTTEWWASPQSSERFADAEKIFINEGENLVERNFQLDPLLNISGKIFYSDGVTPVRRGEKNIKIFAHKIRCESVIQHDEYLGTNEWEGDYLIWHLPPGTYYLQAVAGVSTRSIPVWWNNSGGTTDCSLAEPIVVSGDQNEYGKNFQINFLKVFPWKALLPALTHEK